MAAITFKMRPVGLNSMIKYDFRPPPLRLTPSQIDK